MPVDFLTEEQKQRYGCYVGEPSPEQLARYFYLSDSDRSIIAEHRGLHNRLGFALQLTTLRFLGLFLGDPLAVPEGAITYVAAQLGMPDLTGLQRYAERIQTQWDHQAEIRRRFGYHDWSDPLGGFALMRFLYAREWVSAQRPSVLFDLAISWLIDHKVLLPGITTLERLISRIRDRVAERVWQRLSRVIDPEQQTLFDSLLEPSGKGRGHTTLLEWLRRAPSYASSKTLSAALTRLEDIRQFRASTLDLGNISPSRIRTLATYAMTSKVSTLARLPKESRAATLLCYTRSLEVSALDDVLDVLDALLHDLLARSERQGKQKRLRTLRDLDSAALGLADQVEQLFTTERTDEELRAYLEAQQSSMQASIETIQSIARPPDDHYYQEIGERYRSVRQFLPQLLKLITFEGNQAGKAILKGLAFLKSIEGNKHPSMKDAPLGFVPPGWKRYVAPEGHTPDRQYYTLCVLTRLYAALRRRDIYVSQSSRWGDPQAKLLQGDAWERVRATVCQSLGRSLDGKTELEALAKRLDETYRRIAADFPSDFVRIEPEKLASGREQDRLVLTPLDKVEEPESLLLLRHRVTRRLPFVNLPELLLELHMRTGFLSDFTHISEHKSRMDDLSISLCAALVAQACNIGLAPLVQKGVPALERDRISHVLQNYIRPETLSRANARLVDYQATLSLAKEWGGGEVASADGLRFVVPLRTLNAGPNPKYFGTGRGITLINYVSDQFSGFKNVVVTGTLRDSLVVLTGLLNQETKLRPTELMTDTASYSDVVFGLFHLLGYRFSPRLADMGDRRFWRIDAEADYGTLNSISRHRIDTDLITENWDDMLRVAGSLQLGEVEPLELMRMLQNDGHPSTLAKAIGEIGRIAKTLYMLSYISDKAYRRRILIQLNKGESRHSLACKVFYGQKGELRQRYREGQEEQLNALGLVVNAIILWNTIYMDRALEEMRQRGMTIRPEDVARLSPIGHEHVNVYGKYSFALAESIQQGAFLPLRELDETEEVELLAIGS
jgi:TnpA family transposase